VVASGVLLCGRCCSLAFCGAFGEKEMIEIWKTARGLWRSLSPPFFFSSLYLDSYICSSFGD